MKKSLLVVFTCVMSLFVAGGMAWADHGRGGRGGHRGHSSVSVHFSRGPSCHRPVYYHDHWGHSYYHRGYYSSYYNPGPFVIVEDIPPVSVVRLHTPPPPPAERVYVERPVVQVSRQAQLLDQLMRSGLEDRIRAAQDLSGFAGISSTAALVDALINDGSSEVRRAAAVSLGAMADPLAYEPLYRSSKMDMDDSVRTAAEQAVAKLEQRHGTGNLPLSPNMPPMNSGREQMADYLEDLRLGDAEVRQKAADKLDGFEGGQTVAALINVLVNDSVSDVRKEAAKSLGKLGDRMAIGFLKSAKYNDSSESVRETSEKAIKKIYDSIK